MDASGYFTGCEQTRDDFAFDVEHFRIGVDLQAAHGVMDARGDLDRVEGSGIQGLGKAGAAKVRIILLGHAAIPHFHGGGKGIGRDLQGGGQGRGQDAQQLINKFFNMVLPNGQFLPKIHAYAWMIISVALCKVFGWLDEDCEIGCYQWFQFVSKNLTPMLLIGIGACYVPLQDVISQFSLTYVVLCLVTVIGAIVGAGLMGKLVGFYPVESAITAGLCMANMGGTGDVACLSAADRMELMPFAQISSRIGGAIILLISSVLLSILSI